MTSFIIIIVIIIIVKFIYDTYLTNNTDTKWKEHKSTVYGIRTDGLYVFEQTGTSTWGDKFIINHILIFNDFGFAFYIDNEGSFNLNKQEINELISGYKSIIEENGGCARYSKNNNNIEIKFNHRLPPDADIFIGTIDGNNLYLTFKSNYFDESIGAPSTKIYFNNKKFKFIKSN